MTKAMKAPNDSSQRKPPVLMPNIPHGGSFPTQD
jgi:hypothetical protein